ncbi:Fur family transcriptional regulator [Micromonospora polyrhachis]|uniref:Fur family ferric uptake transcriptional regulator n=1 Tax=Micromonospora polyrhachis TaxID=1282883 RepID=A0A7W7ST57_9ACTN|nr:Fur family transcriptional regulator [Micromonospora polyrhachis]MBB4960398.1 Fur family ferric uptake transcriptional regulator [Micromonospora polyrhachis]
MPIESDAERLRAAGLRVTAGRLAVLAAIRGRPHLDAEAITRSARRQLGRLSAQAVYDTLHALTDAGLVRRFQPARGAARYELRVGGGHHHMVCRKCGSIRDVGRVVGPASCLAPERTHAFQVEEIEVTFWGHCPGCQEDQLSGGDE